MNTASACLITSARVSRVYADNIGVQGRERSPGLVGAGVVVGRREGHEGDTPGRSENLGDRFESVCQERATVGSGVGQQSGRIDFHGRESMGATWADGRLRRRHG